MFYDVEGLHREIEENLATVSSQVNKLRELYEEILKAPIERRNYFEGNSPSTPGSPGIIL
jgi:protein involved in temperature-dependent protein secretion